MFKTQKINFKFQAQFILLATVPLLLLKCRYIVKINRFFRRLQIHYVYMYVYANSPVCSTFMMIKNLFNVIRTKKKLLFFEDYFFNVFLVEKLRIIIFFFLILSDCVFIGEKIMECSLSKM